MGLRPAHPTQRLPEPQKTSEEGRAAHGGVFTLSRKMTLCRDHAHCLGASAWVDLTPEREHDRPVSRAAGHRLASPLHPSPPSWLPRGLRAGVWQGSCPPYGQEASFLLCFRPETPEGFIPP